MGEKLKNCALGLPCQMENTSENGSDYKFPDKIHISKIFSKRDLECEKFNLPGVYIYLTYALHARTHFQYKELI